MTSERGLFMVGNNPKCVAAKENMKESDPFTLTTISIAFIIHL
jgi:hypothetical protein